MLLSSIILLLPTVLTFWFRWSALRAYDTEQKSMWVDYRGFGRFLLAASVTAWWVEWEMRGRSALPSILVRYWPGTLETSSAEFLLFWIAPVICLGIFLLFSYSTDRMLLKQRWSVFEMFRRAWWRLVSFVIPLQMVAAGFTSIFDGRASGVAWLVSAGVVHRIGTGFLRRAEGMKLNALKTGELRNRALVMAKQIGVMVDRVFMVPAGKGHLTNAFGMSNAIGLTDSLGKYLTKPQVDYVIAHELGHIKLKHGRKHLLLALAIFSTMTLLLFRLSQHAPSLKPVAQVAVIFGFLGTNYYLSRRLEYAADEFAVEFTGEPEVAIWALANLCKAHEVPAQHSRFSELFMTHPSFKRRADAISKVGKMPTQQLNRILEEADRPPHQKNQFRR